MTDRKIVLVGATGYTGRLVAETLMEWDAPFSLAGRDERALRRLAEQLNESVAPGAVAVQSQEVDLASRRSLRDIAGPDHLVVSCAGPFGRIGTTLARVVAETGGTYLDISGEQPFVAYLMEEVDAAAKGSGALLVPSCAFESLPAAMLADRLCRSGRAYEEIASFYRVENPAMSPGTALTMRLLPFWDTVAVEEGVHVHTPPGGVRREPDLPYFPDGEVGVFTPYPEVRFWARRFRPRRAFSFTVVRRGQAALLSASARRASGRRRPSGPAIEEVEQRQRRRARPGPTPQQRSLQHFTVSVAARPAEGARVHGVFSGSDPYGLTARIVSWICREWIQGDGPPPLAGVRSPDEVVDSERFFAAAEKWTPACQVAFGSDDPQRESNV